jgi:hypothetical protein
VVADAERRRHGVADVIGVGERREVHPTCAVRQDRQQLGRHPGGERRLPRTGRADERHERRARKQPPDLAELPLAPNQSRNAGGDVADGDRRDEAVPHALDRLDEARSIGIVTQEIAQPGDARLEHGRGDVDLGPDGAQQLFLGDQAPWMPDEVLQHRKRLGCNGKPFGALREREFAGIELKGAEVQLPRLHGRTVAPPAADRHWLGTG